MAVSVRVEAVRQTGAVVAIVLQLSDIHLTDNSGGPLHGLDPDARLATVVDAWQRLGERADLVLVTGDDTETGSEMAYRRLAAALATIDAPSLVIPGNHDDPAVLTSVFGPAGPVEIGSWRVVGIDSSRPDQIHGTVDVDAVVAELDGVDDRPTVLAIHHPPRPPSTHPEFQLERAEELLIALERRPHVRAVVSGHLHQPFEYVRPGGLQLLGAPSTNEPIDHRGDTFIAPGSCSTGARVLRLHDDGTVRSAVLVA